MKPLGPRPRSDAIAGPTWSLNSKAPRAWTLFEMRSSPNEFAAADTNARFEIVLRASQVRRAKAKPSGRRLTNSEGKPIGKIERAGKGARLILTEASFADFLAEHLPRLHAEWRTAGYDDPTRGGAATTGR